MESYAHQLLQSNDLGAEQAAALLSDMGFDNAQSAYQLLRGLAAADDDRAALAECLPVLLLTLKESASPDGSLINFQRFVDSVGDRGALFRYLGDNPRAVQILVKLFVGSQFLTEVLLRRPQALEELTNHKRLAEFKSRQELTAEAAALAAAAEGRLAERLDAIRRFHHWELLRIGACDAFMLFDLKHVTLQLSLLADSMVQSCLDLICADDDIDPSGFVVMAFGKLGGEELNYSSDIDLVFLCDTDAARHWKLGQRLIGALEETTGEGFLYRVDMRLRPWGRSGALVNTVAAHLEYLRQHGQPWEKQAMLKARPIAGNLSIGEQFLKGAEPIVFSMPPQVVRDGVREMKSRIETNLEKQGRVWGEVKSGAGSIRDVEFVTQCLQLIHGRDNPHVRSVNTMSGLVRLADFVYLEPTEYYKLASGYTFLRIVEHALQLMHHKQAHSLPTSDRELAYLARRLDFANVEDFLQQYERHCHEIRQIYRRYIEQADMADGAESAHQLEPPDLRSLMAPSYAETFGDEDIALHAELLGKLSMDRLVHVDATELEPGRWRTTIVGYNHTGELSLMCGLLFVHGFDILEGNVFTAQQVADHGPQSTVLRSDSDRQFVNVFIVTRPLDKPVPPDVWQQYRDELEDLVQPVRGGQSAAAHGKVAKLVAGNLQPNPEAPTALLPVTVAVDNEASQKTTVLRIEADDTIGFLYELTNALALAGVEIERVIVRSHGNRVNDTLFVTDAQGRKITDATQLIELRSAIALIKHFTHLLPHSPNPESALLQFRDFLVNLFDKAEWGDLSSLEQPAVLRALAKLLGVSTFLWEDFLRLQHDNLFPIVANVEALEAAKTKAELLDELQLELAEVSEESQRPDQLNRFKDRQMFRIDMRHILGHSSEFGQFAEELSDLAEAVVEAAARLCDERLRQRYGTAQTGDHHECPYSVCALGKCGGRELGFASDIELMFIYEDNGSTTGPTSITTTEYFLKLVECFTQTIRARQKGIFEIDLRLRPYGRTGSLAVSLDAFRSYFQAGGAAWPYERQALVKLRPIAGDPDFGQRIVELRDELIYSGETFDAVAMRAMRERQVQQLVAAGTFNAKLSPGGLVDCEYIVQGLQITHGHRDASLRTPSTRKAIAALGRLGILTPDQTNLLMAAYVFLRGLIDALRMVRGNARDLTLPEINKEEFQFLARRLGYDYDVERLQADVERHARKIVTLGELLDSRP